ncbi:hypothetical protein LJR074_001979 [Acidovorax sp. LjRoot74]|uniref:hypothetical protein n=1 Tax=Acidovorax sp. LjRoot74 TaxID=3342337 RepID=UPI003ECC2AE3
MNLTLLSSVIAAAVAAAAAWAFQDARYTADIAEMRLEHANDVLAATSREQAKQRAIDTKYQGALNAALSRQNSLRRDAAVAQRESDGLRAQLSDAARRIADAPPATVAEYATASSELLAVCSRERSEFAAKADGHASDVRTLLEAWPVIH